jgi:hypothetical protein
MVKVECLGLRSGRSPPLIARGAHALRRWPFEDRAAVFLKAADLVGRKCEVLADRLFSVGFFR